jgi:hypothetical protein
MMSQTYAGSSDHAKSRAKDRGVINELYLAEFSDWLRLTGLLSVAEQLEWAAQRRAKLLDLRRRAGADAPNLHPAFRRTRMRRAS